MNVPTPSGEVVFVDPSIHRHDVVRRLLDMGVSARTLLTLLPTWDTLIRAALIEDEAARHASSAGPDAVHAG